MPTLLSEVSPATHNYAYPQKAADLRDMSDAIQSDPDYPAWQQNVNPDAYHNPMSFPGVQKNPVLSQYTNGDVGSAMGLSQGVPYSFAGADGNVYSGNALSGTYQASGVKATQGALSQQYGKLTQTPDQEWGQKHPQRKALKPNKKDMDLGAAIRGDKFSLPKGPMKPPGWD